MGRKIRQLRYSFLALGKCVFAWVVTLMIEGKLMPMEIVIPKASNEVRLDWGVWPGMP